MYLTAAFTVAAFLIIGWDATRQEKKPAAAVLGLGLFVTALVLHLFGGRGVVPTVTAFSAEIGLGFLLAAGLSALRKSTAKPFFALGVLTLVFSGLMYGGMRLFGTQAYDTSFLLELGPDDHIAEVEALLTAHGAHFERAFPTVTLGMDEDLAQMYLVEAADAEGLMEALRADRENVDHVEINLAVHLDPMAETDVTERVHAGILEDDPLVAKQWGLDAIHAHEAHALLAEREPVRKAVVAILDTGVDAKHEDVEAVFRKSGTARDGHGHGSHCAGIAGAVTNNGRGIASLNWEGRFIEIAAYPALNDFGSGTLESIAQAVIDAAQDGVDVISMSLGVRANTPPKVIAEAVAFAQERGVVVVASAGNSNQDGALHTPSNVPGVLTVAAIDEALAKARFSNTNHNLERPLAAPGVNILSLKPNQRYVSLSGTSMSTPMVSGLIGVLRAFNPDLTAAQIYTLLHDTGTTVPDSDRVGRVINAEAALRTVLDGV